jgi:hypothetical protein
MISTAATTATARDPGRTQSATQRVAAIVLAAEMLVAVVLILALGVIAAADAAGLDALVPSPGPMPVPSIAPPGLDL